MDSNEIISILETRYFSVEPDEAELLKRLPDLLRNVRHFVDIGASLGQYTFHANQILQGAKIDAIEAEPLRFEKLRASCSDWVAVGRNAIHAHHYAVGETSGEVAFHTTQSNVSGGLFQHPLDHLDAAMREQVAWKEIRVPAITLDEFFRSETPDFIKMDIEGAELGALKGAKRLLALRTITWLIELHDFGESKPQQVVELMWQQGYGFEELAPGRVLFRPLGFGKRLFHRLRRTAGRFKRFIKR